LAVNVFKPPAARSQELVAKLVALSRAIVVESSVSSAGDFRVVEERGEGAEAAGIEWFVGIEWIESVECVCCDRILRD
jgi:hypothetical protein